jgi:hypothetical protein
VETARAVVEAALISDGAGHFSDAEHFGVTGLGRKRRQIAMPIGLALIGGAMEPGLA